MKNLQRMAFVLVLAGLIGSPAAADAVNASYRYDSLNRLIGVTYANGMSIGYSYDATGNLTRIARGTGGADVIPPNITAFGLPAESSSLVIAITPFTATDNVAVTGYCVVQTSSPADCSWSAAAPSSYTFAPATVNGSHTLYAFARDAAGNSSAAYAAVTQLTVPQSQLSVTIQGLYGGGGSVNSNPAGIACVSGTCSADYASGTSVTLAPTADISSLFSGWSGDCSGSGNCTVSMTVDRSATASFSLLPKARVAGIPYGSLTTAYAAVTASGVLEAQALVFDGDFMLGRNVSFMFKGGYASDYLSRNGFTTLNGKLTIGAGGVTIDRLIIK
ncbi:MAG: hypothetical protein OEL57_01910 [Trichlorobacter sp.]|uniref:InlB B-repeat-containing protein n=1 Tax=Trichlorobacter sp. TaxID=2911007 RepID=UPI00256CE968|nr:hypothetical protein [Trichlorobacter sp.]MDK9716645.1 hypothetical protein [Trichlorobacter sp.]